MVEVITAQLNEFVKQYSSVKLVKPNGGPLKWLRGERHRCHTWVLELHHYRVDERTDVTSLSDPNVIAVGYQVLRRAFKKLVQRVFKGRPV